MKIAVSGLEELVGTGEQQDGASWCPAGRRVARDGPAWPPLMASHGLAASHGVPPSVI